MSVLPFNIEDNRGTYNLMKHERLSVDLYRYPFNIPIQRRITNIDSNHEPLDGTITEWFPNGVVVEIAFRQRLCPRDMYCS